MPRLIRTAVLMRELPCSIGCHDRFEIIGRIAAFIARRPVADFKIDGVFLSAIDKVMSAARSGKPCTHSGRE